MKKFFQHLALSCVLSLLAPALALAAPSAAPASVSLAAQAPAPDPSGDALAEARAIIVGAVGESGYNTLVNVLGADPFAVAYLITHSAFVMSVQEIIDSLGL